MTSEALDKSSSLVYDRVVLSQLLDARRLYIIYQVDPVLLVKPLTRDILRNVLMTKAPQADVDGVGALLDRVRIGELRDAGDTVASLMRFDLAGFPLLSALTMNNLRKISGGSVSKEDVRRVVERDFFASKFDAVEQSTDFFFKFGSESVSGIVFHELLSKIDQPYGKVRYSKRFASEVVQTIRNLGSSIPYLVLLIVVVAVLDQTDLWSRYSSWRSASTPSQPWSNFCVGGVVNGTCHFERRNIRDSTSWIEGAQYVRNEFVSDLWHLAEPGKAASSAPFEGSVLVGGLLIRVAPSVGSTSNVPYACADNNISITITEPFMSAEFDCSSWVSILIPFSATLPEALEMVKRFPFEVPEWVDAAIILQYAMHNPSSGNIVWVTASLGLPKYGSIVPRITIQILDSSLHSLISFCMWFSLALLVIDIVSFVALFKYSDGFRKALSNLILRAALFGIIATSYSYKASIHDVPDLFQSEFIPKGLDEVVFASQRSEMIFAIWIFVLIAIVLQFIGHIEGLQLVVKLLEIILPELLGLFFVFAFFYVGFVMVGMVAFGATEISFNTFLNCNESLLDYFFAVFDVDSFVANYPQTGFAFYYVFRLFLLLVVTNFCIITIIAPIKSVWIEGDLPVVVWNVLLNSRPTLQRWRMSFEHILVSIAVFFLNGTPVMLQHWLRYSAMLEDLYSPTASLSSKVRASQCLLDLVEKNTVEYDTPCLTVATVWRFILQTYQAFQENYPGRCFLDSERRDEADEVANAELDSAVSLEDLLLCHCNS